MLSEDERKKAVGRKVALAQGFRMRCDCIVEDTTDGRCVTSIKVEYTLCHNIRRFGEVPNNPARLAVPGEEGRVLHPINHGRRADIPERHFTVRSRRTFVSEEINLVSFGGILVFLTGGKHCKTAIDALRALPTMGMKLRHVVNAGAAPGVPDEVAATVRRYSFDDFCLPRPGERIVDTEVAAEHRREQALEPRQGLRMRRSCRPGADDLGNRGQIQADHAILEKTDAVAAEHSRGDDTERREKKRSCPVGRLPAEADIEIRPDGNMEHTVGAEPAAKLVH